MPREKLVNHSKELFVHQEAQKRVSETQFVDPYAENQDCAMMSVPLENIKAIKINVRVGRI